MEKPPEQTRLQVPEDIPEAMHGEWLAIVADLKSRHNFTEAMFGVIGAYVTALWNMRQAQKALDDYGQVFTSPKGVLMKNPAVTLHGKAQATVMRLSAELGLTPAARSRPRMKDDPEGAQKDMFDGTPLLDF
ncbi:phage terminase small subunit P27 family [Neorhizobium sp. SOG26]|uniref:phage terminase small subunit P27 family n=1 Tax=Neorhizobium sp. SOG26 TaxID=2060726 RepID=UPI000E592E0B|nr:phage terminase small subunit P27 family [Neorhizobium sp. SOG26]AXV15806.1 phage terminase small subunit P27 family [Neorhizobium sp. SOG26]